jgi:hypothetical protein
MWWGIIVHYFKDEILSYHNIISNDRTVHDSVVFVDFLFYLGTVHDTVVFVVNTTLS